MLKKKWDETDENENENSQNIIILNAINTKNYVYAFVLIIII